MAIPVIYADFNSLEASDVGGFDSRVGLTGYGSIASLSTQGIRLTEGMNLIVCEPSDIEAEGIAHFDSCVVDPAGRQGEWFVLVNREEIRDTDRILNSVKEHLCLGCRKDLFTYLNEGSRLYREICPYCGTSIMAPLAPP